MFNVSCIHNTPKNATRVKSSIELAQVMKSLGSFHDFSYIGVNYSSPALSFSARNIKNMCIFYESWQTLERPNSSVATDEFTVIIIS